MVPKNPANPVKLKDAIDSEPMLQQARDDDPAVGRMLETALKLEGLYRHASTHAAGVVIGDRPLDDIPRYINCKHGREQPDYLHPSLEGILKETFGIMIYQEQVMEIAKVLSGFTLGNADLLRRAMGKKIKEEMEAQRKAFIDGALANNVSADNAAQIFDQVNKFAGYGFNKSHAAAYALVAYQTAWLKANYPVEFLAASMTYELGNTDKLNVFRQELTRQDIALLPPDINKSHPTFSVERQADGSLAVRYALAAVKNVGLGAVEAMVKAREGRGPVRSLAGF